MATGFSMAAEHSSEFLGFLVDAKREVTLTLRLKLEVSRHRASFSFQRELEWRGRVCGCKSFRNASF